MTKSRSCLGLAAEAPQRLWPVSELADFESDVTIQDRIARQEDGTHTPLTQLLDNAVAAELLG
jgi:hypothetical protein